MSFFDVQIEIFCKELFPVRLESEMIASRALLVTILLMMMNTFIMSFDAGGEM